MTVERAPRNKQHRSYTVGTFNVLGASHTDPGGNKPGMLEAHERMKLAVRLITGHAKHGPNRPLDVVGLQEFEPKQRDMFLRMTDGQYGVFPKTGDSRNAIVWNKERFDLVEGHTIPIPYFGGKKVDMPVVLLRDKVTGKTQYFMNFHNPASTKNHPGNEVWRNKAEKAELEEYRRLRQTGIPVHITGDFNESHDTFERFTKQSSLHAANPGPGAIDYIFGSPDLEFSNFNSVRTKASDHALKYTRVIRG